MAWTSITELVPDTLRRHHLKTAIGVAALIEAFNTAAAGEFDDRLNERVAAVSYVKTELTVYCKSPVYAAAVRERRATLIDPLRTTFRSLPVNSIRFIFRK